MAVPNTRETLKQYCLRSLCKPEIDIPRYLKLYQRDDLSLNEIITERYKLRDINLAISRIREGKAIGRVMIDFE